MYTGCVYMHVHMCMPMCMSVNLFDVLLQPVNDWHVNAHKFD